jgi:hypothetical protein
MKKLASKKVIVTLLYAGFMLWVAQTQGPVIVSGVAAFMVLYYLPWLYIGEIEISNATIRFVRFAKVHEFSPNDVKTLTNLYWFPWTLLIARVEEKRPRLFIAFDSHQFRTRLIPFWTFRGRIADQIRALKK